MSAPDKIEEFTDALNRNTARLQSMEDATIKLYDRLGEYLIAIQAYTKELVETRAQMADGRWRIRKNG